MPPIAIIESGSTGWPLPSTPADPAHAHSSVTIAAARPGAPRLSPGTRRPISTTSSTRICSSAATCSGGGAVAGSGRSWTGPGFTGRPSRSSSLSVGSPVQEVSSATATTTAPIARVRLIGSSGETCPPGRQASARDPPPGTPPGNGATAGRYRPGVPRPSPATLLAGGLLAVVAACSDPSVQSAGTGAPSISSSSVTESPAPTRTPEPPEPPEPLTLAFAGDVHFSGRLEPLLTDGSDPSEALAALRPTLSAADVTVLNLEAAITERGAPEPKKFHFRVPTTALDALAGAGVDVVSMANNHGVDYGSDGLDDTLASVAGSPVDVVGIGADAAQAYAPALVDARGTDVAVLAATQVPDHTAAAWRADDDEPGVAVSFDPDRLVEAVAAAARRADVVVVYLHWGTENTGCPDVAQRSVTPRLVDAGADVVVGAHAHQLQGMGWLTTDAGNSAYVAYGLGNFVWWRSNNEVSVTTGVLTLTLPAPTPDGNPVADPGKVTAATWTPMRIADDGIPVARTGADATADLVEWNKIRDCADLSATPPR